MRALRVDAGGFQHFQSVVRLEKIFAGTEANPMSIEGNNTKNGVSTKQNLLHWLQRSVHGATAAATVLRHECHERRERRRQCSPPYVFWRKPIRYRSRGTHVDRMLPLVKIAETVHDDGELSEPRVIMLLREELRKSRSEMNLL